MVIIGIDPSTVATGWCIMDDEKLTAYGEIKCNREWTTGRKMRTIFTGLSDVISKHRPSVMVCEKQFQGKFASAVMAVSQVRGVVELVADVNGIEVVTIAPAHHKKIFVGTGKATKKMSVAKAQEIYHINTKSNNVADAISLAYTYRITGGAANGDIQGYGRTKTKPRRT